MKNELKLYKLHTKTAIFFNIAHGKKKKHPRRCSDCRENLDGFFYHIRNLPLNAVAHQLEDCFPAKTTMNIIFAAG
jgi:hypothetical protein